MINFLSSQAVLREAHTLQQPGASGGELYVPHVLSAHPCGRPPHRQRHRGRAPVSQADAGGTAETQARGLLYRSPTGNVIILLAQTCEKSREIITRICEAESMY